MIFFNFFDLTKENLFYNPFDINLMIIYLLDAFSLKNLLILTYFDLVTDMAELFGLLIIILVLLTSTFNLLLMSQQLVSPSIKNSTLTLSTKNINLTLYSYLYYIKYNYLYNFKKYL